MRLLSLVGFASALGSGLVAGVFFAFSTFVMKAFARLPSEKAVAAMQSINVAVLSSAFMPLFVGTALLSLVLVVSATFRWSTPGSGLMLLGGVLYLIGTFGVTVAFNVPLNDRLGTLRPEAAAEEWTRYLATWTLWNHVRTIAALVSTAVLMFSMFATAGSSASADR